MIELKSLQKKFGDNIILDVQSFKLKEGIYWIKGINGSGKTTLLKIISGIIPFKGDVLINNISQKNSPVDYRKLISYAEAEPLYPGFLNGQEILDLYTSVKKEKEETINELLELLQVHYYIKTATGTYSSGMLKKLDYRLMMLIYTMCLIGNGVIIHKVRTLEETRLTFYRQLAIPRWKRWMQYFCFYFLLMVPELIIFLRATPLPLHSIDTTYILLFTLSFLLLLHSVLSSWLLSFKDFLKSTLGIFFVIYFFIVGKLLMPLIALLFLSSTLIFVISYYKFELNRKSSDQ